MSHGKHEQPTRRRKILGLPVAGWLLLAGVGAVAALLAIVSTPPSNLTAESRTFTIDADGALFDSSTLGVISPGDELKRCVVYTYEGSEALSTTPRLYGATDGDTLGDHLELYIAEVDQGSFTDQAACEAAAPVDPIYQNNDGSLNGFAAANFDRTSGRSVAGLAQAVDGQSIIIRYSLVLPSDVDNAANGATVGDVVWTVEE